MKKRFKKNYSKSLLDSFNYAIQGIISAFISERNLKIHIIAMLLVVTLGFILNISIIEWLVCIILFGIVIAGEIFNTAIEVVVDLVIPNLDSRAKLAKDLSAGAVLVLTITAVIIGFIIFLPKI